MIIIFNQFSALYNAGCRAYRYVTGRNKCEYRSENDKLSKIINQQMETLKQLKNSGRKIQVINNTFSNYINHCKTATNRISVNNETDKTLLETARTLHRCIKSIHQLHNVSPPRCVRSMSGLVVRDSHPDLIKYWATAAALVQTYQRREEADVQGPPRAGEAPLSEIAQAAAVAASLPEREAKLISYLVSTTGKESLWTLKGMKPELETLGRKIDGVNPLTFLRFVICVPNLKKGLQDTFESSFKKPTFMRGAPNSDLKGFGTRLSERRAAGQLGDAEFNEFITALSIPSDRRAVIKKHFDAGSWAEFVQQLIQ